MQVGTWDYVCIAEILMFLILDKGGQSAQGDSFLLLWLIVSDVGWHQQ